MFKGSIVALITPMDTKGVVDKISLKKLINYHIISGTKAIVVIGTTGEGSTLTHKEHYDIVMWTIEFSCGRIPIIVCTGSNSTSKAVSLTSSFNNSGVTGYLIVTPYYNQPNQTGLFLHFKAIAECTDIPQILYNIPKRTGCDILPVTISRLAKIKNIIGIKESTGNLSRVNQIKELVDDNFVLLSGDDSTALDFMQLGGHGVISVTANIAAKEMSQLCTLASNGQFGIARQINRRLMPIHQKLLIEPNPIPVKWACKILKLIATDTMRLPMSPLSENYHSTIRQTLIDAGLYRI